VCYLLSKASTNSDSKEVKENEVLESGIQTEYLAVSDRN
jgi:hypothetical protein